MASEKGDVGSDKIDNYRFLRWLISKIPYRIGNRFFPFLMSLALVQLLFRRCLKRIDAFQYSLCGRHLSKQEKGHFLLTNYLSFWRLQAIAKTSEDEYGRLVSITGLKHIERFYGQRGIVLCNSHFGAGKIVPIAVARAGYEVVSLDRLNILGANHKTLAHLESIELGRRGGTFHLKQLMRMKSALTNKKILHVVGDGYRGTSGNEYSFLGKQRTFRRSFAELAVSTDSVVLPVFSRILADGSIQVEICEPLDLPVIGADKDDKTDSLCGQYVTILERHWLASPADVHKNDVFKYFALEQSTDSKSSWNSSLGNVEI